MSSRSSHSLLCLSPLDGRYQESAKALREHFSEYALMQRRVLVEVRWLVALAGRGLAPELDDAGRATLERMASGFCMADAVRIKEIEAETRHDVKAVEYFIRERMPKSMAAHLPFVHFACTSEDINNLAYALMLRDGRALLLQKSADIAGMLAAMSHDLADAAMLSRTHGQAASPTTMGKELANFCWRLRRAASRMEQCPLLGKINGAVGNYNAHYSAWPDADWPALARDFVQGLGLEHCRYSTQIEPHDYMAELFGAISGHNLILKDLCRDLWGYISLEYFRQAALPGEVGSSTMPHKVNPIDFENAEGNLGLANALLGHLAAKLPVSRWQRDLSDSTVLRNIGTAFGHSLLAAESLLRGLPKLQANREIMHSQLAASWAILAEPMQTILRRHGHRDSYEKLSAFSRGKTLGEDDFRAFIDSLDLPEDIRGELRALRPETYLGNAESQARAI